MIIKDALAVIKPHLPIFQSELLMQAWQTLEDYCTQPTAHNISRDAMSRIMEAPVRSNDTQHPY